MKGTINTVAICAIAILMVLPVSEALAEQQEQPGVFEGTLVQVDAGSGMLTMSDANGEQTQFMYTPETEVTGEANTIQGLTGQSGASLRITWEARDGRPTATVIEVLPQ